MFRVFCSSLLIINVIALELGLHSKAGQNHAPHGKQRLPDNLEELTSYTLSDFMQDFGRTYKKHTKEWHHRTSIFNKNHQDLIHIYSANGLTWKPGITKFMDYDDHEYKQLLGYRGHRSGGINAATIGRMASQETYVDVRHNETYPPNLNYIDDHTKRLTPFVREQGRCGSCWAEAAISVLEGVVEVTPNVAQALKTKAKKLKSPLETLSGQAMVSCTKNPRKCGGTGGCAGGTAELAYEMVKEQGVPLASEWLYSSYDGHVEKCKPEHFNTDTLVSITGYTTLPKNKFDPLIHALVKKGHPIAVAVDATGWSFYNAGIYSDTGMGMKGQFTINHEVVLMGYQRSPKMHGIGLLQLQNDPRDAEVGIAYWLIKNSWGQDWGERGFIRIEMKQKEEEHCGWDRNTHIGIACEDDPDTAWVCGTCGILYDATYPTGVKLMNKTHKSKM